MPIASRRQLLVALQVALTAAIVWFAGRALADQWEPLRHDVAALLPSWWLVTASATVVLAAYAVLIQTWCVMLGAWNAKLTFANASRIWFISNLGKYVPGKVWQIAALALMTQQSGVSPVSATAASLVVNLANVLSGFLIVLITGARLLDVSSRSGSRIGPLLVLFLTGAFLLLPMLLPHLARLVGRLTRREVNIPALPARAMWIAVAGTAAGWVLYGLAFRLLAVSLWSDLDGSPLAYIAVFTSSYLVGYLALFAPGGIVVREAMLVAGMRELGLATDSRAWALAILSRLWLTVLEVIPGLLYIARDMVRKPRNHSI